MQLLVASDVAILPILPKLRGEEVQVERRRTAAVVRLVMGSTRGGLRRGNYARGIPTTAVG